MAERRIFHEVKGPGHIRLMDRDEKIEREAVLTMYPGKEWRRKVDGFSRETIRELYKQYTITLLEQHSNSRSENEDS